MKAIYLPVIAMGAATSLSGCSTMLLSNANALADDVYYDGTASPRQAVKAPEVSSPVSSRDVASYEARVANYSVGSPSAEGRDFSQIQQYYANANSTNGSTLDASRTLIAAAAADDVAAEPSDGYWVDGYWGSESEQSYAERIIRFHRPLVSVNYYSPFFSAARYSGDWNIYVDGYGSSYLVPTWTNPWYNDYFYGSGLAFDWYWSRPWRTGWTWGGYGWYGGFGFGWRGYDYAWGWPHHHHHMWGYCGPWHDVRYGHGIGHWGYRPHNRPVYASRTNTAPRSYSDKSNIHGVTTNPNGERAGQRYRSAVTTTSRSYTRSADGRSIVSGSSSTGTANSSSYSTNTRRSTIGLVESAAGSTATTNKSSYSTNTRRSTTSNQSATYESGSSSRSTYTPSRSSARSSVSTTSPANSRGTTSYSTNTRRGASSSSSYSPNRSQMRSSGSTLRSGTSSRGTYSGTSSRSTISSGRSSSGSGRSSSGFSGGGRSTSGSGSTSRGGRTR